MKINMHIVTGLAFISMATNLYAGNFDEFENQDWGATRMAILHRFPEAIASKCFSVTAAVFKDNNIECAALYIADDQYQIEGIPFQVTFRFFAKEKTLSSVILTAMESVPKGLAGKRQAVSFCSRIESMLSARYGLGEEELAIDNDTGFLKDVRWLNGAKTTAIRCRYPAYGATSVTVTFKGA